MISYSVGTEVLVKDRWGKSWRGVVALAKYDGGRIKYFVNGTGWIEEEELTLLNLPNETSMLKLSTLYDKE
jgi:hypothetical protein